MDGHRRPVLVDEVDQRLGKAQDCRRADAEGQILAAEEDVLDAIDGADRLASDANRDSNGRTCRRGVERAQHAFAEAPRHRMGSRLELGGKQQRHLLGDSALGFVGIDDDHRDDIAAIHCRSLELDAFVDHPHP